VPKARPAAGGGRWIPLDPARLGRWLDGFGERHGTPLSWADIPDGGAVSATDGARAECHLPFGWPAASGTDVAALVAAARATRRVGLLLVRRGAHAVGVADGDRLVSSKVDTRYVQGRTAAGGWSQQRFARRRDKQTRESTHAAADHAARLLSPETALSGLVVGGDRALLTAVLDDPRLRPFAALPRAELPDVPEPRHATLVDVARRYREVRIRVTEPGD
jgi:hypothetical protein